MLAGWAMPARADLYFQQDVHVSEGDADSPGPAETDFVRKVYIFDGILSVQIFEKDLLKKEYGFDFKKNLYYEADPAAGYYKWFDLALLDTAFKNTDHGAIAAFHGASRQRVVRDLSRSMQQGRLDYPVRIRRALRPGKTIEGHKAVYYKLREGPGGTLLNPFGWYRTAVILATEDIPGFGEYSRLRAMLAEKARFYKIKHNRISDFIVTISSLGPFPVSIETSAQGRYGHLDARQSQRETTSFISTAKISREQLLYFKESARFSWNIVFSQGTDFGPEVAAPSGPDPRRALPGLSIPVFFLILAYAWFFGGVESESIFSLKRTAVLRALTLFSVLLALEIIHYFTEMPFLVSPFFEFTLLFAAGAAGILAEILFRRLHRASRMREEHLLFCPHCGAPVEEVYLICPKCNFALKKK